MTNNRSTGPRSAEGKARSSMNALKTGIYAKSLVIPREDPERLDTLTTEYFDRFRPSVPEQRDQVDILIRATWELRRLAACETQVWIDHMEDAYVPSENAPLGQAFRHCDASLTRLHRIVSVVQRSYRDALHELERLQKLQPSVDPDQPADYAYEPSPEPRPSTRESAATKRNETSSQVRREVDGTN